MASQTATTANTGNAEYGIWRVIVASAAGTMIEWYDFFIFGSLVAVLSLKFYPPGNDIFAYVAYLTTFAVGFVVRPFGALFFGRIGDVVGRKYAFLATLSIMGGATALIGLLPTFKTAGWFAPITVLVIRMLQGLAVGGEYGGAAVYVAEQVPDHKRGFYTSFIQITGMLGLFVSLIVVRLTEQSMTKDAFDSWGWRLPFLLSIFLVGISLYVRSKMRESPIFSTIKSAGKASTQPLKDAFTRWENLKQVIISLFGTTAACGVVAYTADLYPLFYLQTILKLDEKTTIFALAAAILMVLPFVILFGWISDKVGRKWLMMAACLLAAVTYIPIYKSMEHAAGNNVVSVKSTMNKVTRAISLTAMTVDPTTGMQIPAKEALNANVPMLVFLLFAQGLYACMIYGPIAAYLVEAFPARIRYTSLSLPYHIGFGIFGGSLPLIGLSLCAATGNIYAGLYYPMIVAGVTFVVGSLLLKETHGTQIWDEVGGQRA
jgi:MFS family permease